MLNFFGFKNDTEGKSEETITPESSVQAPLRQIKTPEKVLGDILTSMGVDGEISAEEGVEGEIRLTIDGKDGALLIGKKGQTLDALEYLLNRICSKRWGNGRKIIVDTENYRKKREEKIISLAQRLAEKVEKSGRPEIVAPLSPVERKIIHTTLRDHTTVETQSEGEGFLKKIMISLKKDK